MIVTLVSDDGPKLGGNNKIIEHIKKALLDHSELLVASFSQFSKSKRPGVLQTDALEVRVEYIDTNDYLPRWLPRRFRELFRPLYLRNISNDDRFSSSDLIITLQPNAHCIRHRNHLIYFQHHLKQYYELARPMLRQKKGFKKKIAFILLIAMARMADRFYLTPNLQNSYVIVNSATVGSRLKKYNDFPKFIIINPGCDNVGTVSGRSLFSSHALSQEGNILSNANHVLLTFSRLSVMQKGIDIVLDVARRFDRYRFVIAGPYDPSTESVQAELRTATGIELNVRAFSDENKAALFSNCDVFLAPYVEEDFGITPLEANSYGKPVVYCRDSGEIVHTQQHKLTGFMCNRTAESIVEGIEFCVRNKEMMGPYCIENSRKYSWTKFERDVVDYIVNSFSHVQEYSSLENCEACVMGASPV